MKKAIGVILFIILLSGGIYIYNYMTIIKPVTTMLKADVRNDDIFVDMHYKYYLQLNTLIFNLKIVPTYRSAADVFRVFLQTANTFKTKKFDKVILEFRGTPKFYINGSYFGQLGTEFEEQNPMYTMRTFPENLYTQNGESAYGRWDGGMLGVLEKQMTDFDDFSHEWYINDMASDLQK